jgi:glycosyltransferase involved in cell wall biosynthesis
MQTSVCMATYNGSKYVREQIDSIICQLESGDELVVVDDNSLDDTWTILSGYIDPRIKIFKNSQNLGVNRTFARAIALADGDIIFLSDQDDVWIKGRLKHMLAPFAKRHVNVVASNFRLIDLHGDVIPGRLAPDLDSIDDARPWINIAQIFIGSKNYYGCAMAFRATFRDSILPYPPKTECHDIWIAMIANLQRSIVHLDRPTLMHRVHGNNASIIKRPWHLKLLARMYLLMQLLSAYRRIS